MQKVKDFWTKNKVGVCIVGLILLLLFGVIITKELEKSQLKQTHQKTEEKDSNKSLDFSKMGREDALEWCTEHKDYCEFKEIYSETVEKGRLIEQKIQPDELDRTIDRITITFSLGKEKSESKETESIPTPSATTIPTPSEKPSNNHSNNSTNNSNHETTKPSETPSSETTNQRNAVNKAKEYLKYSAFSYQGLVDQLVYSKFTEDQARYGADHCGANWSEQSLKKAKEYLKYSSFSYQGLVDQLKYSKFTEDQARYGADHCEANWSEQSLKKAKEYLKFSEFSYQGLVDQLIYSNFTEDQAKYGADHCGANWYEQAVKKAKSYLKYSSFSRQGLIEQLQYDEFTYEQAVYGVENNGL